VTVSDVSELNWISKFLWLESAITVQVTVLMKGTPMSRPMAVVPVSTEFVPIAMLSATSVDA